MTNAKALQKPVTPGSVKALMAAETVIIGFLAFWFYSEYTYNAYFQTYVNSILLEHITTYTAAIGTVIGLSGSAAAITLWRSVRQAKSRLGAVTPNKIRGSMERLLSTLPAIDEPSVQANLMMTPQISRASPAIQPSQPVQTLGQEEKHSSQRNEPA